ncbi:MAG: hypothetical protein HC824_15515 [Synechococcales cyanobacterium RM1_1_8]|nr:hypothetical protein [Synechococcales cyanobacterium RM1_1_8]
MQTRSYQYEAGRFTANAAINPLAGRLLGRILEQEIPSALSFSATDLAGFFEIPPQAQASFANGDLSFDSAPVKAFLEPYFQQALRQLAQTYSLSGNLSPDNIGQIPIETLDALLNYELSGQGRLESDGKTTTFRFQYSDGAERFTLSGIDAAILASCQVQRCETQLDGELDLKLDVQGLNGQSDRLNIELPPSLGRALEQAQRFGIRELPLADGKLTSAVQTLPNSIPSPAPSPALPASSALPLPRLTQGNFTFSAERMTAPWFAVFSVSPNQPQ